MQSGYGVPELQQFMVDGCSTAASLLPISYDMNAAAAAQPMQLQQQQHGHFFRPPAQSPPTHHFFLHHQFHGFPFSGGHNQQQQQRRMHPELGLGDNQDAGGFESSARGSPPPKIICGQLGVAHPRFVATNFSLAVSEAAAAAGEEAGLNGDDAVVGDGSDGRALPRWHQQQARAEVEVEEEEVEAAIKEPFWKRLDNMEYMSRNGKSKEKASIEEFTKAGDQILNEEGKTSGSNYGFFSELEAIYSNRSSNGGSGGSNQAGSGSALTGDNTAHPAGAGPAVGAGAGADHGSETSAGEEASRKKLQKSRRKSRQRQLSSIAGFFQGLVKQLMDHQESLHCKFLEVMERREGERVEREETWRRQESARINEEAAARAQEQTLASTREAAIISYLEKISGESLKLPSKIKTHNLHNNNSDNRISTPAMDNASNNVVEATHQEKGTSSTQYVEAMMMSGGRRWPKSEVQALIRIRSGLEKKFQEPGLKAPLWDEVSASMAGLGYQRSAKRCKEKWENINKYFRKTKESAKKRPRHSKTCPYFHQLDQLYSKSQHKPSSFSANPSDDHDQDMPTANPAAMDSSDLLAAIVVTSEQAAMDSMHSAPQVGSFVQDHSFDFSDRVGSSLQLDDDGNEMAVNELNARQVLLQLQEDLGNEEDDEEVQDDGNDDQDDDDDDEEEGADH